MKLLPNYFKIIGLILAGSTILMNDSTIFWFKRVLLDQAANYSSPSGFADAFISVGPIIGLLLFVFAKEKMEDEWSSKVREQSLSITLLLGVCLVIVDRFIRLTLYLPDNFLQAYNDFDTLLKFQMVTYMITFKVKKHFGI